MLLIVGQFAKENTLETPFKDGVPKGFKKGTIYS